MIARTALSGLCLAAAGLAACGSSPPPGPGVGSGLASSASPASCAAVGRITGQLDDRGARPASGSSLVVSAGDSYFSPTCLTGVPAGTVTLTITNTGRALHNVSVASEGIDSDIPAGTSVTVKVSVPAGTPLAYFCKYHRASGMKGALVPGG